VEAQSGERLRGKGRRGVLCRLKAVCSMPERFRVVCTIKALYKYTDLPLPLTSLDDPVASSAKNKKDTRRLNAGDFGLF